MAGQLKIGGNVIATHSGTEGAGTVTLDSSTLTIGSNTTIDKNAIPAGHVVQTSYYKYDTADSNVIATNTPTQFTQTGTSNKVYKAEISSITSGNDVLVTFCFPCYVYKAAKLAAVSFYIFRDDTIVYGVDAGSGNKRELGQYTEGTVSEVFTASKITLVYMDENPSASSHTYTIGSASNQSANTTIYSNSSSGAGPFTSIIQEIQR